MQNIKYIVDIIENEPIDKEDDTSFSVKFEMKINEVVVSECLYEEP